MQKTRKLVTGMRRALFGSSRRGVLTVAGFATGLLAAVVYRLNRSDERFVGEPVTGDGAVVSGDEKERATEGGDEATA